MGDAVATTDALGFSPYVQAVAEFLSAPETKAPLTLSLEGRWGSGKSSFAVQLRDALKRSGRRTAWFDPWLHGVGESFWASFALQLMRELANDLDVGRRIAANVRLFFMRYDFWRALPRLGAFLVSIAVFVTALFVEAYALWTQGPQFIATLLSGHLVAKAFSGGPQSLLEFLATSAGAFAIAIVALAALRATTFLLGNPFESDLKDYLSDPRYRSRETFVETFRRDFGRILDAYVGKDERVYVFVDDIDRCAPDEIADIVHALNLLSTADSADPSRTSRLIFVVAIDRPIVSAALAARHEQQLKYLYRSPVDATDVALRFGYAFVDKFVQAPFQVPTPKTADLGHLLQTLHFGVGKSNEPTHSAANSPHRDLSEDREFILLLARLLDSNPRKLKQLVNLYRLYILVAEKTGLLEARVPSGSNIHPRVLAKWLALQIQWPTFAQEFAAHPESAESMLRLGEGMDIWASHPGLFDLLHAGASPVYDLTAERLIALVEAAPPRETSSADEPEARARFGSDILEERSSARRTERPPA
ncbi:MAG TPA: P-loop NTPase fold protein [Candidatus Eremiobacteraceae bacterium]|nr:P-loop NTPase fold protein [Candidatus Eremiobacteraceae bacterium]